MIADPDKVWVGLEYFCNEGDDLWRKSDAELAELAKHELAKLNFAAKSDVLDTTVIRMPKAYPAYFGTYDRFERISDYTDGFDNLFLIGRHGMHRYNNQDHSMLAAMTAVDNILDGVRSRHNLWSLNTEMEYHEEKQEPAPQETNQVLERTRANGLLVGKGGMYGNVIRMAPPMNISKADVDEGIRLLDKSFGEVR